MKAKTKNSEKLSSASTFIPTPELIAKTYQGVGAHEVPLEQSMGMCRFVLPWVFAPWEIGNDHPCCELVFTYRGPGMVVLMFRCLWPWYVAQLYADLKRTCSITAKTFDRMYIDAARVVRMAARRRVCISKDVSRHLNLDNCRYLVLRGRSAFIEIMSKADYDTGGPDAEAEVAQIPPDILTPPGVSRDFPGVA